MIKKKIRFIVLIIVLAYCHEIYAQLPADEAYYFFANQEDWDFFIFHVFGLTPDDHTIRLVVKGDKRKEATGTKIYITEAQIFDDKK